MNWNFLGGPGWTNKVMAIVMFPMSVMFFISMLAETNRPPFDLPDAESELVAGYQVEYSSTPYLLLMLSEYCNIVLLCSLISVMFFGGWHSPFPEGFLHVLPNWLVYIWHLFWFAIKTVFWFFMVSMAKAIVPRYRYDQLMRLGWKVFLPTSLVGVVLIAAWRVFGPAGPQG